MAPSRRKKYISFHSARTERLARVITLTCLLLGAGVILPRTAEASIFSSFFASFASAATKEEAPSTNMQTLAVLSPAHNVDPAAATGGGDVTVVDDSALVPQEGPSGTLADIVKPKNSTISTYTVRQGDTLSGIAKLFDVSPSTILWANDLPTGSTLKVGQQLTILPVTGVKYTVKKGDTIVSIAKRFGADSVEVATFNAIDDSTLAVGTEIIIPDGEITAPAPKKPAGGAPSRGSTAKGSAAQIGYYMAPIGHYVKTQGIHGYNGVDLAAPIGTPIYASAAGKVVVAKSGGYNGGYGSYVVIQHGNGSQTLYSHMSKVSAYVGEEVDRGQVVGAVGSTGKSTGAHLHFEIRNGIRNPF